MTDKVCGLCLGKRFINSRILDLTPCPECRGSAIQRMNEVVDQRTSLERLDPGSQTPGPPPVLKLKKTIAQVTLAPEYRVTGTVFRVNVGLDLRPLDLLRVRKFVREEYTWEVLRLVSYNLDGWVEVERAVNGMKGEIWFRDLLVRIPF